MQECWFSLSLAQMWLSGHREDTRHKAGGKKSTDKSAHSHGKAPDCMDVISICADSTTLILVLASSDAGH